MKRLLAGLLLLCACDSSAVLAPGPLASYEPEPAGSCYGYQPVCHGLERSCCICNAQGLMCNWGCCR